MTTKTPPPQDPTQEPQRTDQLAVRAPAGNVALGRPQARPRLFEQPEDAAPLPDDVMADVQAAVAASRADNTVRAYKADLASWTAWCRENGQHPLPAHPTAVAAYVTALATQGRARATIRHHLATISRAHTLAKVPLDQNPTKSMEVQLVLSGLARKLGTAQRRVEPITDAELAQLLTASAHAKALPVVKARDRAILTLGLHGAFRASELAALTVADVKFVPEGLVVTVRKSKTDQHGEGFVKAVGARDAQTAPSTLRLCAVEAVRTWIAIARLQEGPLFRPIDRRGVIQPRHFTGVVVAQIVQRYALAAGFDPRRFASHSLRAGYVTQALEEGHDTRAIRGMTGHKTDQMIDTYDRRKKRNPFAGVAQLGKNKEKK